MVGVKHSIVVAGIKNLKGVFAGTDFYQDGFSLVTNNQEVGQSIAK